MLIYFSKNNLLRQQFGDKESKICTRTSTYVLNEPELEMFNKSSYAKGDE